MRSMTPDCNCFRRTSSIVRTITKTPYLRKHPRRRRKSGVGILSFDGNHFATGVAEANPDSRASAASGERECAWAKTAPRFSSPQLMRSLHFTFIYSKESDK